MFPRPQGGGTKMIISVVWTIPRMTDDKKTSPLAKPVSGFASGHAAGPSRRLFGGVFSSGPAGPASLCQARKRFRAAWYYCGQGAAAYAGKKKFFFVPVFPGGRRQKPAVSRAGEKSERPLANFPETWYTIFRMKRACPWRAFRRKTNDGC